MHYNLKKLFFAVFLFSFLFIIPKNSNALVVSPPYFGDQEIIISNIRFDPSLCDSSNEGLNLYDSEQNFIQSFSCSLVNSQGELNINNAQYFQTIQSTSTFYIAEMFNIGACQGAGWACDIDYAYESLITSFSVGPPMTPSSGSDVPQDLGNLGRFEVPGAINISGFHFDLSSCDQANDGLIVYDSFKRYLFGISCSYLDSRERININRDGYFDSVISNTNYFVSETFNLEACGGQDWECQKDYSYDGLIKQFTVTSFFGSIIKDASSPIFTSYRPEVFITKPISGQIFSRTAVLGYYSSDLNDSGSKDEKERAGLLEKPASIYFSDKIGEWDHTIIPLDKKTLIAKDQPKSGEYEWEVEGLSKSVLYRFVVSVIDRVGDIGEAISEFFSYDPDSPQFIINSVLDKVSGELLITLKTTEDLSFDPELFLKQRGLTKKEVTLIKSGDTYKGSTVVDLNYDGQAEFEVNGVDLAGNKGDQIISGRYFHIGEDEVPAPEIELPLSFATSTSVSVKIKAREDLTLHLKLNGKKIFETRAPSNGVLNYAISELSKEKGSNGLNLFSVYAVDYRGYVSPEISKEIRINVPPKVSIISPRQNAILKDQTAIILESFDENNDKLFYTYEIKKKTAKGDEPFFELSSQVETITYDLYSNELENGDYFIRVKASDGALETYSPQVSITINNTLPVVQLEDGRRLFTGNDSLIIKGNARVPDRDNNSKIISIEYSTTTNVWNSIDINEPSGSIQFSISLFPIKAGESFINFRIKDDKEKIGRYRFPIIRDNLPPFAPTIENYSNNHIFSDLDDENNLKQGVQVSLRGRAEPRTEVVLNLGKKTYKTSTSLLGSWKIDEVTFLDKGFYDLVLESVDSAKNVSQSKFRFLYNNSPNVLIINPSRLLTSANKNIPLKWIIKSDSKVVRSEVLLIDGRNQRKIYEADGFGGELLISLDEYEIKTDGKIVLRVSDGLSTAEKEIIFKKDTQKPRITKLETKEKLISKFSPIEVFGLAVDNEKVVDSIEYCLAKKTDGICDDLVWKKALIKSKIDSSVAFDIKEGASDKSGEYLIKVRAKDMAGNISDEISVSVIIDSDVPIVENFSVEKVEGELVKVNDSTYHALQDSVVNIKVKFSEEVQNVSALYSGLNLDIRNSGSSTEEFYISNLNLKEGISDLLISASDKLQNNLRNERLVSFEVLDIGQVTLDGNPHKSIISIYLLGENGYEEYGITNFSSETNEFGEYRLKLSKGKYLIKFTALSGNYTYLRKDIETDSFINDKVVIRSKSKFGRYLQSALDKIKYGI